MIRKFDRRDSTSVYVAMAMDLQQANDYSKVSHMTSAQKKSFHTYTLELVHGALKNDDGHKENRSPRPSISGV